MAAPPGWVSPRWAALARRPLFLGLPYFPAGIIFMVWLYVAVVLGYFVPATVAIVALWVVGAALTIYDPYATEQLIAAMRMPRKLRAP